MKKEEDETGLRSEPRTWFYNKNSGYTVRFTIKREVRENDKGQQNNLFTSFSRFFITITPGNTTAPSHEHVCVCVCSSLRCGGRRRCGAARGTPAAPLRPSPTPRCRTAPLWARCLPQVLGRLYTSLPLSAFFFTVRVLETFAPCPVPPSIVTATSFREYFGAMF